jgi:putative hydroxymethylpyrimidine transport system substrate-binding protein
MKKLLLNILISTLLLSHPAFAEKKLIVLLDWFANPSHAPLFVAQQQGYFKEQGIEVELIGPADPADPPKLVAAGKADIAITYEPQFIEQVDKKLPLIRIGTLIDKPLNCLVVLEDGPIKKITDLKGKNIGYSVGSFTATTLKTMLEHHGLNLKDINRINVHYNLTQALLAHKVDAVTGMMRTFELIQMDIAGHPGRPFLPEKNGVPTYSELILVVNKNQAHDPRFKKFLAALQKGVDYLQKHPKEAWQQFAKNHPALNDSLNRRAWFASLPYFAKYPAEFNQAEWLHFAAFLQHNGLITVVQPIDQYVIKE